MRSLSHSVIRTSNKGESPHVVCRRFLTSGTRSGELTLDVGCGSGEIIAELADLGCKVIGIEVDQALIAFCLARGLAVREGKAESLPFDDDTFDRIVCGVVVPYTEEEKAVSEWARTLKPGGQVYATYHGVGYGLNYMLRGSTRKFHAYGACMLVNTVYYWTTGRRLSGPYGDTLCQGIGRLRGYYDQFGLVLERECVAASFLGLPQLICHQLSKR